MYRRPSEVFLPEEDLQSDYILGRAYKKIKMSHIYRINRRTSLCRSLPKSLPSTGNHMSAFNKILPKCLNNLWNKTLKYIIRKKKRLSIGFSMCRRLPEGLLSKEVLQIDFILGSGKTSAVIYRGS